MPSIPWLWSSLAGWDTTTAPRLQDWLADRLAQDYPAVRAVDPAAPRVLVEQGFTLPVLDGLDELPDAHRPAVIRAINSSLGATDPLVLTCSTEEYRDAVGASEVLRAAAVIEPESLTRSKAANYLLTCLPTSPTRSIPARCWTMPTPRRCGRNCSTSSSLRSSGPGRPPLIPTTRCVRGAPTTCAAG